MSVRVAISKEDLTAAVCAFVLEQAVRAVSERGIFTVAFSGGSLPEIVGSGLISQTKVPWDKWVILFADERLVPLDHADSNYKSVRDNFLKHVSIPEENVIRIDPSLSVEAAAASYERSYTARAKDGIIDLLLLGMGPDGHTCSLFPNHALLNEQTRLVAPISDSPKPPPQRITLTLRAVNSARAAAFVCTGDSKAEVLRQVLEEKPSNESDHSLPARMVKPLSKPVWFVDSPAAAKLTTKASCETL